MLKPARHSSGYRRRVAFHRLAFTALVYSIAFFCLFVVRLMASGG